MSLLRHDCPATGTHFDWLLATCDQMADPEAKVCRTLRCSVRPDQCTTGARLKVDELELHRAFYMALRTSHQLSHGRGTVFFLRCGKWRPVGGSVGRMQGRIELAWHGDTPSPAVISAGDSCGASIVTFE